LKVDLDDAIQDFLYSLNVELTRAAHGTVTKRGASRRRGRAPSYAWPGEIVIMSESPKPPNSPQNPQACYKSVATGIWRWISLFLYH